MFSFLCVLFPVHQEVCSPPQAPFEWPLFFVPLFFSSCQIFFLSSVLVFGPVYTPSSLVCSDWEVTTWFHFLRGPRISRTFLYGSFYFASLVERTFLLLHDLAQLYISRKGRPYLLLSFLVVCGSSPLQHPVFYSDRACCCREREFAQMPGYPAIDV